MPHQASVVVSDIRKTMMVRRRISGSANRSATVKRVSAVSLGRKRGAAILARAGRAPLGRRSAFQTSDSSIDVLIHNVTSAGRMPMTNM